MALQDIQKIEKPWGYELIWARTQDYVGKILHINKGHSLSLQYHEKKEETIYIQSGVMSFVHENDHGALETITLKPGEAYHIVPRRKHRMTAVETCEVFEVSTPFLDDVIRLQDGYGRA